MALPPPTPEARAAGLEKAARGRVGRWGGAPKVARASAVRFQVRPPGSQRTRPVSAPIRPFVDTNVLLYLLSQDAAKADCAEALLAGRIVISVQVLNEFANVARRKLAFAWIKIEQALFDIRRFAEVRPLTLGTHEHGIVLAKRYQLSVYDAMIAAAALEAGCTTLASEDFSAGQRLEGRLVIRNPFA